ncbi:MAG: fumarylacetoacetate hydrolase family protein [Prevotellaceae bacterium]|jgi:2-keto-4-pentenoate hydratase/2-oxohepta-3-ene-1,7-dioic acid hydratase in catechol pathway|nr:fumarylacetoacetate hydrolase family protein [Prevotellaceae bacterium]
MKIICIGLNYIDHLKEMGSKMLENPVFFMKPDTALLRNNQPFFYPDFTKELHYELELVLRIHKVGRSIAEKYASKYYNEIGIGIDFTARDIQRQCKDKGLPWEIAKAFDYSAPISSCFIPLAEFNNLQDINFRLDINGKTVQQGNSRDLIFGFNRLVSYVSQFLTLKIGDLIFTGTPAGVGQVKIGDNLKAYIGNELLMDFEIK